jgi:hypothetical protein
MKKTLYKNNKGHFSETGNKYEAEIREKTKKYAKKLFKEGYPVQEVESLILFAVNTGLNLANLEFDFYGDNKKQNKV